MNKLLLFLSAVALLFTACSKDEAGTEPDNDEILNLQKAEFKDVDEAGETIRVDVTANNKYTFEILDDVKWVTISTNEVSTDEIRYFDVAANDKHDTRIAKIAFTSENGKITKEVTITQSEKYGFGADAQDLYELGFEGGKIEFDVEHNTGYDISISEDAKGWITQNTTETRALVADKLSFSVAVNMTEDPRAGTITLSPKNSSADPIIIDVEQDMIEGKVTISQTAEEGNGIDLIFMGDGFTVDLIADGTYMSTMERAIEHFFAIEPHKSFRRLYNVYIVTAISEGTEFGTSENRDGGNTAIKCWFGASTSVGGNRELNKKYVRKAISEDRMDEALSIIIMNRNMHAGTCQWENPSYDSDYGSGYAGAYLALGTNDSNFKQLVQHECGHGFAKLADEYVYSGYGAAPANPYEKYQRDRYGWCKNIDFTNNLDEVYWAKFIDDTRYGNESVFFKLGLFEGATYKTKAWRSTEQSMMNNRFVKFNAPSREAIYYRIHKLAYGKSWQYDYEKFVAWDLSVDFGGRISVSSPNPQSMAAPDFIPTHPPVLLP